MSHIPNSDVQFVHISVQVLYFPKSLLAHRRMIDLKIRHRVEFDMNNNILFFFLKRSLVHIKALYMNLIL